jgi:hypothetical protein
MDPFGRKESPDPATKLCRSLEVLFSKLYFEILSETRINLEETKWQCR